MAYKWKSALRTERRLDSGRSPAIAAARTQLPSCHWRLKSPALAHESGDHEDGEDSGQREKVRVAFEFTENVGEHVSSIVHNSLMKHAAVKYLSSLA
jgi:hypothetical protein